MQLWVTYRISKGGVINVFSWNETFKKVCNRVEFSRANFKYLRNWLTFNAAKLYMDAMIMSHLTYCITSWGQTDLSVTAFTCWSIIFQDFKILHNTAPPPLNSFILKRNSSNQNTRSTTRGDLLIPFRKSTFGQHSFSVRAIKNLNKLPTTINDIHSQVHKYWDINTILIFLALYTTTMDLK